MRVGKRTCLIRLRSSFHSAEDGWMEVCYLRAMLWFILSTFSKRIIQPLERWFSSSKRSTIYWTCSSHGSGSSNHVSWSGRVLTFRPNRIANYYIFFMVLTTSLQDPSFNFPSIEPVNAVMQYIYVGTVIASFLMSLGNRPQGSKWKYLIAVGCFSLTTAYMYAAAVIAVYHVIVIAPESSIIFTQIIVSLLATCSSYPSLSLAQTHSKSGVLIQMESTLPRVSSPWILGI